MSGIRSGACGKVVCFGLEAVIHIFEGTAILEYDNIYVMHENSGLHDQASPTPLLPDPDRYALTIGEASEIMKVEGCKFSSMRKVQRLCRDGHIDCHKLTTARNGQPVTEWLVNETSLRRRIEQLETRMEDGYATRSLGEIGAATVYRNQETAPNDLATQKATGDANTTSSQDHIQEHQQEDVTSPNQKGDASIVEPSKAELMIENAKLLADLGGTKSLIREMVDDKNFLREELRDAREGRKDVTKIAERMLQAMETMAIGAKFERLPINKVQAQPAQQFDGPAGDSDKDHIDRFGV